MWSILFFQSLFRLGFHNLLQVLQSLVELVADHLVHIHEQVERFPDEVIGNMLHVTNV